MWCSDIYLLATGCGLNDQHQANLQNLKYYQIWNAKIVHVHEIYLICLWDPIYNKQ